MARFRPSIVLTAWLTIVVGVYYVYKHWSTPCIDVPDLTNKSTNVPLIATRKVEVETPSNCILPKFDSWDSFLMKYTNLRYVEQLRCKSFVMLTELRNGKLIALHENLTCFGRCLTRVDERTNEFGKWKLQGETFDCEIVETKCSLKKSAGVIYNTLHTQAIPKTVLSSEDKHKKYNVFVILIDSMGSSQADRNIPKTMRYFEKSMKAVTFPYLNKVGYNSKPNGIALWFGKQIELIDRTVFGLPSVPVDWTQEEVCDRYLDNHQSIFQVFKKNGYQTFLADDWSNGVVAWPYCHGFRTSPVDHNMQSFQIAVEDTNNKLIRRKYKNSSCDTMFQDILKYHHQFLTGYKNEVPTFSWIWTSYYTHDYYSKSIRMDTEILDHLVSHRNELDDSFVILMSDHGFRGTELSVSKLGKLDKSNPLLSIALPKDLRDTELAETMIRNSQQLQTHFDIRAILLDISLYQPNSNFTDVSNLHIPEEKGQSLLRKQIGERSCRTLPIPYQYCICDMHEEILPLNTTEAIEIGNRVINHINHILVKNNFTRKCAPWVFSKVISFLKYQSVGSSNSFGIVVGVSKPYKDAQFTTVVNKRSDNLEVGTIDRVDSFGNRGNCVPGFLMNLCHCKHPKPF